MRDEHIIQMLEREPLSGLNESELAAVRAHAAGCHACGRAYEAARLSELMLRERRAGKESWSLLRLWKAAGALVSSMAVTAAALAALTFLGPEVTDSPADAPDEVSENELTYEQVLSTIYEAGE